MEEQVGHDSLQASKVKSQPKTNSWPVSTFPKKFRLFMSYDVTVKLTRSKGKKENIFLCPPLPTHLLRPMKTTWQPKLKCARRLGSNPDKARIFRPLKWRSQLRYYRQSLEHLEAYSCLDLDKEKQQQYNNDYSLQVILLYAPL